MLNFNPEVEDVTRIVPVGAAQVGGVTVAVGVAGRALGEAVALQAELVQPFTVRVSVYVPPEVTVIDEVVAPLDHSKEPVAVVDRTEFPQLFTTVITGVDGLV